MSILKISREEKKKKQKQTNAIIAEIKMRKWKKFLQNVEQRIKWWKLWKKGKDIGVLGDENETRWGELLTKETEEKFTVLKSFESLIIKVLTKCFEGIEMDLYLESYPGKFVDSKDKQKSHNSQDAKKERKNEREKKKTKREWDWYWTFHVTLYTSRPWD